MKDTMFGQVKDRTLCLPRIGEYEKNREETDFLATERAQVIFCGHHLVIETTTPDKLRVEDLLVGKNSQTACWGPLDARAFAPWSKDFFEKVKALPDNEEVLYALCNLGNIDTAQIAQDVTLHVKMRPGAAAWKAKVYGDSAEGLRFSEDEAAAEWQKLGARARGVIMPFPCRSFVAGQEMLVTARPQVVFKPKRLVYAGPPGMFVLVDAFVGWDSVWKGAGHPETPLEEFAPVWPVLRRMIEEKTPTVDIVRAAEANVAMKTLQVSQDMSLLVRCVAKEEPPKDVEYFRTWSKNRLRFEKPVLRPEHELLVHMLGDAIE
jgi:hypothetical protein